MAVLPTFNPEGSAADAAQIFNASANTTSSIMDRAAQSKRADQQLEMQRQQFEIQKPVLMAQAQAQIAHAGAQLIATKKFADLDTQFSQQLPQIIQAREEIARGSYLPAPLDADGNPTGDGAPDWAGAYDAYNALAARLSPFSDLKEGKAIIDSINLAAFDAHTNFITDQTMKTHQAIAEQARQEAMNRAILGAQSREAVGAGHDAAKLQGDTIGATSRETVAGVNAGVRQNSSVMSAYTEIAKELDSAAEKESDSAIKAALLQKAQAARSKVDQQATLPTAAAAAPTVSANTSMPSETPATTTSAPTQPVYRPGTKVIQNGVTYQFDGTNWNPVTK
jgi:hypothetical protein